MELYFSIHNILPVVWASLGVAVAAMLYILWPYCNRLRAVIAESRESGERRAESGEAAGVSVIVYTRDEAEALSRILGQLKEQLYPGQWEIIVVSDGGSEDVKDVVTRASIFLRAESGERRAERAAVPIYLTYVPAEARNLSRRKMALTLGMKAARYPYVLITDARCQIGSPHWLGSMARHFAQGKGIVLGWSRYEGMKGVIRRFNELATGITWLSAAIKGKPYRGTITNIGIERQLFFDSKGFSSSLNLEAGEDDLFIHSICTRDNTAVEISRESILRLKVHNPWKEYREDCLSHVFTGKRLPQTSLRIMGLGSWMIWLWWAALAVATVFSLPNLLPVCAAWVMLPALLIPLTRYWQKGATALDCHIATGMAWWCMMWRWTQTLMHRWRCGRKSRRNYVWRSLAVCMALLLVASPDIDARRKKSKKGKKTRAETVIKGERGVAVNDPRNSREPFVEIQQPFARAERGLQGRNIALWGSHGRYFDPANERWKWQRPRMFGTVEDLLTQTLVTEYLAPMLELAGAYVMMPRERDMSPWSAIAKASSGKKGEKEWRTKIPQAGNFAVYVRYPMRPLQPSASSKKKKGKKQIQLPKHEPEFATYTIHHLGGANEVKVDRSLGGNEWTYLGKYDFGANDGILPVVTAQGLDKKENPGEIRIGGGRGRSGLRRYCEDAAEWLSWSGMPEKVYSPTEGASVYKDDYMSRGCWVNYLAGGSAVLPDSIGLGIPIDMSLGLHTDAGRTDLPSDEMRESDLIGTLALYSTNSGQPLGNGRSRQDCRDLAEAVANSLTNDLRRLYDPTWPLRGINDKAYAEARAPQVPALLLEMLSHQNADDMRLLWSDQFRFDATRAIYKGIVRFFASLYGHDYAITPLAIKDFDIEAAQDKPGHYRLSWAPTIDPLEATAFPSYYIIEERVDGINEALDDNSYRYLASSTHPYLDVIIGDTDIHSYRITAANDGGRSFPSETLSLRFGGKDENAPQARIINAFTSKELPITSEATLLRIGSVYDDDITSEYVCNSDPGRGASFGEYADMPLAGNSLDYTIRHGQLLAGEGYGFTSSSLSAYQLNKWKEENAQLIDVILGDESYPALILADFDGYLNQGGQLLVSGTKIGSFLGKTREHGSVSGVLCLPDGSFTELMKLRTSPSSKRGEYFVDKFEALSPSGFDWKVGSRFADSDLAAAGVAKRGGGKIAACAFPLEIMQPQDQRQLVARMFKMMH